MAKISGVYRIWNTTTSVSYVGASLHVRRRISSHFTKLRYGNHVNQFFQTDYHKYGRKAYDHEILEVVPFVHGWEMTKRLGIKEHIYTKKFRPNFNIRPASCSVLFAIEDKAEQKSFKEIPSGLLFGILCRKNDMAIEEIQDMMQRSISILDEWERVVIKHIYGLEGCERLTFGDMARQTGWSRVTIYMDHRKALEKMRRYLNSE